MRMNYVVPCLMGLESLIADELKELEAEDVRCENARVFFSGDEHILARANICLRHAERVQIVIGTFKAYSFEDLFQGTKNLPWEDWIGKDDAFPVKDGYSRNSKLFSISDCQAIMKKAIVERLKSKYKLPWFNETGTEYPIKFSIMNDEVTVVIDTSGSGLHKRGYRPVANDAPIKETLAASLCTLARLRPYHTLYDPMCGSGTILIEGAMKVLNIAPGLNRTFAAEGWRQFPKQVWDAERDRARSLIRTDSDFMAYGSDIDPDTIKIAKENAKRAGVADHVQFEVKDLKDFEPKTEKGTVICNPPYGERLLDINAANDLYRLMGQKFQSKKGWSYYAISPSEDFEKYFGKKADKRRKLYNGMIKCQLYMYFK
ncbi:MAG: class I SAM-dependent RNA methyltransferase [Oscillospiraceae bacterium]|nr:class I SAM-dependent RNA methyltransferase [Candidatus Limimonas coprohippi]